MARIMCTQRLWQRLGRTGRPPSEVAEPAIHGVVLGSWAAKVCRIDRLDLVIALNERTYLTVVFPLAPRRDFRANLNQIPHAHRDPCVPLDAARRLFEGVPAERPRVRFY